MTLSSFEKMLMAFIYVFAGLTSLLSTSVDQSYKHAVYVSVVEISHTSSNHKGSMQVKLFTDDLADAILNKTGQPVKLDKHCEENLEIINSYLREHLNLTINGKTIDYHIKGCENVDISTWLEFSFECDKEWSSMQLNGDQLMELFPTQSNVFSIKYNDKKRMFRLTNSKKVTSLTF